MNTLTRISAHTWNRMVDRLARWWPLSFTPANEGSWPHPWWTTAQWNAEAARWEARVLPGFVNGLEPLVRVIGADGVGEDVGLIAAPGIALETFRVETAPPKFFAQFGLTAESLNASVTDAGQVQVQGLLDAANQARRTLQACDLVLDQPRLRSVTDVQVTGGAGVAGSFATVFLSYAAPASTRPYVRAVREHVAAAPVDLASLLEGRVPDSGLDTRRIATVYLMSPEGETDPEAVPDETWQPFVAHGLFWNLSYSSSVPTLPRATDNLTLNIPLAAGLLQSISNQILASVNDANNQAAQLLAGSVARGRFWSV